MASYAKIYNQIGAINQYDLIASANITLPSGSISGTPIDGVSLTINMYVVLPAQTTASQNGVYEVTSVASGNYTLTKVIDFSSTSTVANPTQFTICQGNVNTNTLWRFTLINSITNFTNITQVPGNTTSADISNGDDLAGKVNNILLPFMNIQTAVTAIGEGPGSGYLAVQPCTPIQGYNSFNISGYGFEAFEIFGIGNNIDITDGTSTVSDTNGIITDVTISNVFFNDVALINAGGGLFPPQYINCTMNNLTIDSASDSVPLGGMPGAPSFYDCAFVGTTNIFPTYYAEQTTTLNILYQACAFQQGVALNGTTTTLTFTNIIPNQLPDVVFDHGATPAQIILNIPVNKPANDNEFSLFDYTETVVPSSTEAVGFIYDTTVLPPTFWNRIVAPYTGSVEANVADGNDNPCGYAYPGQIVDVYIDPFAGVRALYLNASQIMPYQYINVPGEQSAFNNNTPSTVIVSGSGSSSQFYLTNTASNPFPMAYFNILNRDTVSQQVLDPDSSAILFNLPPNQGKLPQAYRAYDGSKWLARNDNLGNVVSMSASNPTYTMGLGDNQDQIFVATGTGTAIIYLQSVGAPYKGQVFNITNDSTSTQTLTIKNSLAGGATLTSITSANVSSFYFNGTSWIIKPASSLATLSSLYTTTLPSGQILPSNLAVDLIQYQTTGNTYTTGNSYLLSGLMSITGREINTLITVAIQDTITSYITQFTLQIIARAGVSQSFTLMQYVSSDPTWTRSYFLSNVTFYTAHDNTIPLSLVFMTLGQNLSTNSCGFLSITAHSLYNFATSYLGQIATNYPNSLNNQLAAQAPNQSIYADNLGNFAVSGNMSVSTIGKGYSTKEGSNAKQGIATLVGGTIVVANTSVTANSRIFLTIQSLGTIVIPSAICVSAVSPGVSFTILSATNTDTSVIAYEIFEPA